MKRAISAFVAAGLLAVLTLVGGADVGTASGAGSGGFREFGGLHALERWALGAEHAREHAEMRRMYRQEAASPAAQTAPSGDAQSSLPSPGPPDQVGEWTTPPFDLPNYAIHAAVLPTGKVLFWGFPLESIVPDDDYPGRAALWDPAAGTGPDSLEIVNPPEIDVDGDGDLEEAPISCSGQSLLPDGEVLLTGGRLPFAPQPRGAPISFVFDTWHEQWVQQPSMEAGRWYPTQVELADGRIATLSGSTEDVPGGVHNDRLEVFTPDDADADSLGSFEHIASGDRRISLYPHLFTMPNGNVLLAGPAQRDSALLNTQTFTWKDEPDPSLRRTYGPTVLDPGGPDGSWRVTEIGGYDSTQADENGDAFATPSTETIDLSQHPAQWTPGAPLNVPRANANAVLLPDGSMVLVGGGVGNTAVRGGFASTEEDKQVELYDPTTDSWQLGPAQQENRAYHSVAVLLPDGRVWSSGDNGNPLNPNGTHLPSDTAEIYSPPYLFRGQRPEIRGVPSTLGYGQRFKIQQRLGERAVLVAPGATTHTVDMNQRLVPLRLRKQSAKALNVVSPPDPAVAPPGYYMLFVLSADNVPSEATWVQLVG